MIKVILTILFSFLYIVVKCEISLERLEAIADLSAVATKYFSEEPKLKYTKPDGKLINSFAWTVSELWHENDSALYILTRLANLVDQKDANGDLTVPARIIRSFAERSEARNAKSSESELASEGSRFSYDEFIATSDDDDEDVSEERRDVNKEKANIEELYVQGKWEAADAKVSTLIRKTWKDANSAIEDIEEAARDGHFNLMAGLIRFGSQHRTLKFIAPELKAAIVTKLLSLPRAQLKPSVAKWLFTMDTYKEDQLKLVKSLENSIEKHLPITEKSMMKKSKQKNSLVKIFDEVREIADEAAADDGHYKALATVENEQNSEVTNEPKTTQNTENSNTIVNETNVNDTNGDDKTGTTKATDSTGKKGHISGVFDEQDRIDEEISKIVVDNKNEPNYDNDGVYDDKEKRRDENAWIVVSIIIALIIVTAIGSYIYLRIRRTRRNRTMLVVTEALETVA